MTEKDTGERLTSDVIRLDSKVMSTSSTTHGKLRKRTCEINVISVNRFTGFKLIFRSLSLSLSLSLYIYVLRQSPYITGMYTSTGFCSCVCRAFTMDIKFKISIPTSNCKISRQYVHFNCISRIKINRNNFYYLWPLIVPRTSTRLSDRFVRIMIPR